MESEGSLPHSQMPAASPCSQPDQSSLRHPHPMSWRSLLILSCHLRPSLIRVFSLRVSLPFQSLHIHPIWREGLEHCLTTAISQRSDVSKHDSTSLLTAVDVAQLYCHNTDTVCRCVPAVTHLAGGNELGCAEINASCRPTGQQIPTVCHGISNVHYRNHTSPPLHFTSRQVTPM